MNHRPTQKSNDASLIKTGNTIHKEHKEQLFCLACTQTAKLAGVSYETDVSPFSPPLTSLILLCTVPGLLIKAARALALNFFFPHPFWCLASLTQLLLFMSYPDRKSVV